jgi:hypothetical protein
VRACSGAVNAAGDAFELDAFRTGGVTAGDQATVSYGENSTNSGLMEKYGFAVTMNPNDRFEIDDVEGDVSLTELELDVTRFTAVVSFHCRSSLHPRI